jgi:selenocysteine lyase/cysteine desulfurase
LIDVQRTPIDFLAADGHKWLLGPEGAGLLYVRRDWIDRLRPIGVGWHSVVGSYNSPRNEFHLKASADRWEGGSFNMPGVQCFGASLSLFHEFGAKVVSARIMDRAEAAREAARAAGWAIYGSARALDRSAIVVLERDDVDPQAAARALRGEGVVVSCRRGRLRISPHFYNNDDDFRRLRLGLADSR